MGCRGDLQLAALIPGHIMAPMSNLTVYNVLDVAAGLDRPLSMADLTYVDDLLVSVYLNGGAEDELQSVEWHRHLDFDELFWVFDGSLRLESEIGDRLLRPGDLAIVPKGTKHRSGSVDGAAVLLLRRGLVPHRTNGKRRLYPTDETGLPHVNVYEVADDLAVPFQFYTALRVNGSQVQVGRGDGRWPVERVGARDSMVYVVEGALTVRTTEDRVRLAPREFTVVPRGAFYHLYSSESTIVVRVMREGR